MAAEFIDPTAAATADVPKMVVLEHVDYKNLPCRIPFEENHRKAFSNMSLKPQLFEGMRFDFTKPGSFVMLSVLMGPMETSQGAETIKIPTAHYEFGSTFTDPKLVLIGRMQTYGRVNARVNWDLTDNLTIKSNALLSHEPHMSHGVANFDYKGTDYRSQLQLGNGGLVGANYMQSVTPNLSMGGEAFWSGQHRKSGVGYAARYNTDKCVATSQLATTGVVALSYVQKASDKVSLATELNYNYLSIEATATVGYDYIMRMARVRGKIDSNGCATAFLEERLNMGMAFILSAEV